MATYNALLLVEQVDDLRAEVQDLEAEVARLESVIESARDELKTFCFDDRLAEVDFDLELETSAKEAGEICPSLFEKVKP